jgi:hypothetical protein
VWKSSGRFGVDVRFVYSPLKWKLNPSREGAPLLAGAWETMAFESSGFRKREVSSRCGSVWLERLSGGQETAGSNPATSTMQGSSNSSSSGS